MCLPCLSTPFALRMVTAIRAGHILAARPRDGVAHLVPPGLRAPERGARRRSLPLCRRRARTKPLAVIADATTLDRNDLAAALLGRHVCRRCQDLTPAAVSPAGNVHGRLVDRAFTRDAYAHLTRLDIAVAARWCRTVEETHHVGRVAMILHGPKPLRRSPNGLAPEARARWLMHDSIERRRAVLRARERTEEDRAAVHAAREADTHDRARVREARAQEAAVTAARGRADRGAYLTPRDRELLGMPPRSSTTDQEPTSC